MKKNISIPARTKTIKASRSEFKIIMNENVPTNQESTNQPSISVRNVANLGTFCFSLVKTVFLHFERPLLQRYSVISRILLYFIQNVYFYTFHAYFAPIFTLLHILPYTYFVYISAPRGIAMSNLANLPQGFVHVRAFLALGKRVKREITRSRVRVPSDYQLDVTGLLVP